MDTSKAIGGNGEKEMKKKVKNKTHKVEDFYIYF